MKEQAGRVRKTHGTIIRTKEKQKANVVETTSKFSTLSERGARLGMIEVHGEAKYAIYFGRTLEKAENR